MSLSFKLRGLVLGAIVLASADAAFAAAPIPLSDDEMAGVYGRGLSDPALSALGVVTTGEPAGSHASTASVEGSAALGMLSMDGTQGLERQLSQQRLQTATTGLQATLKLAQALTLIGAVLPFPTLFSLPSLAAIEAGTKH